MNELNIGQEQKAIYVEPLPLSQPVSDEEQEQADEAARRIVTGETTVEQEFARLG